MSYFTTKSLKRTKFKLTGSHASKCLLTFFLSRYQNIANTRLQTTPVHLCRKSTRLQHGLSRHFSNQVRAPPAPLTTATQSTRPPSARVFTRRSHRGTRSFSPVINRRAQSAEDSESAVDGTDCKLQQEFIALSADS